MNMDVNDEVEVLQEENVHNLVSLTVQRTKFLSLKEKIE